MVDLEVLLPGPQSDRRNDSDISPEKLPARRPAGAGPATPNPLLLTPDYSRLPRLYSLRRLAEVEIAGFRALWRRGLLDPAAPSPLLVYSRRDLRRGHSVTVAGAIYAPWPSLLCPNTPSLWLLAPEYPGRSGFFLQCPGANELGGQPRRRLAAAEPASYSLSIQTDSNTPLPLVLRPSTPTVLFRWMRRKGGDPSFLLIAGGVR